MPTTNFEQFTANQARGYASLATKYAKELAPNSHLRASINSTVEIGKGRFVIRVRASGPDAAAREYGSGIHSRRLRTSKHQLGPRGKILIRPKAGKKFLAFPWEMANENIPRLDDGRVLLTQVEHPGVEAANNGKGYIAPAISKVKEQIRTRFTKEAKPAIVLDLRASIRKV